MRDLSDLLVGGDNDDSIVAYRGRQRINLAQFRRDVAHNASCLAELGCQRGLLVTQDSYWCAVGLMALFQIGARVVLPQNTTAGAVGAIEGEWDLLISDRSQPEEEMDFRLRADDGPLKALKPIDADSCHLGLFTSGSTGHPKRVDKTLAAMQREARAVEGILGDTVSPDSRVLGTVTHQHLFGLSFKLVWPLCTGRPFEAKVHEFWEELLTEDLGQAVVIASPAHLKRLGDLALGEGAVSPSCLLSAGSELPDDDAAKAQKALCAPLCEIYGSTETGMIGQRWRDAPGRPWRPAPGVVLRIADDRTLSIQSPFLPDSHWFQTEDRAEETADGFYLRGRADRIVKVEGKRVSLIEVEAALAESPLVEVAALLPIGTNEIELGAVVVPSAAGNADLARLGAFRFGRLLRQHLALRHETAAMPRRWRFVAELPVGSMGKTRQEDLRRLFNAEKNEPDILALRRYESVIELDLFNAPDLVQLDGHFPAMPIVPGVAQIDWAVKLSARYFDLSLDAAQNYQVKFHRLTLPGTMVTLALEHDQQRARLSFSYRRGDDVLTSGFIRLAPT